MNNNSPRLKGSFLTVLVMSSVISIKMAYLHAPEYLFFLLVTIPATLLLMRVQENR